MVREHWDHLNRTQGERSWLGGTYFCSFPPNDPNASIQIDVDLTEQRYPITWTIRAPDSAFYPGRHAGRLEIWGDYPFDQPYLIWDTPMYSIFVRLNGSGSVSSVSSPFDLGKWQPFYTIQDFLQTAANIIVLDPYCMSPPTTNWPENMPWRYSDLLLPDRGPKVVGLDRLLMISNFFCRVYNSLGEKRSSNPCIDGAQRSASIAAITTIQELHGPLPDHKAAFSSDMTNEEWIREERRVADLMNVTYKLGFS